MTSHDPHIHTESSEAEIEIVETRDSPENDDNNKVNYCEIRNYFMHFYEYLLLLLLPW